MDAELTTPQDGHADHFTRQLPALFIVIAFQSNSTPRTSPQQGDAQAKCSPVMKGTIGRVKALRPCKVIISDIVAASETQAEIDLNAAEIANVALLGQGRK